MPRYPCPVCGDPGAYPLWVDKEPPAGCPHDEQWHSGGEASIKDVTQCAYSMNKARQRAEFRKAMPEAFDRCGNMKPGQLGYVLGAWADKFPGQKLYI